jgi:hypothetical protein
MNRRLLCSLFSICFLGTNLFASFNFSNSASTFRIGDSGSSSTFYLNRNITGWDGTLKIGANGSISNTTSKTVGFSKGFLNDNEVRSRMTATYEPSGTYEITLGNDQILTTEPGEISQPINVNGTNVTIEGGASFANPIVFSASMTASFGLKNRLNQNIQFDVAGTNTIYLIDDLRLADDVTIVNDGTIDVNGNEFWFGGKELTLTNDIYWLNAGAVNLTGRLNQSGKWAINSETVVNGHGNVLDISAGYFDIKASTTLHLTDMFLAGVKGSTFVFGDDGSTVRMSKVTMQLIEDSTYTQGLFYFDGPGTVYLPNYTWAINSNSELTVSAVTVWKDATGNASIGDVTGNLTMVYNGTIKEAAAGQVDVSSLTNQVNQNTTNITALDNLVKFIHGPLDFTFASNITLTVDTWLSNDHVFTIGGDMTINGSRHSMSFANVDPAVFELGSNTLTFENITLKDFFPEAINMTTGSVKFGDGTIIEITDNIEFASTNYTMSFDGGVDLCCHGHELDISKLEHAMDVQPGSTLSICHARISGLGGTAAAPYINNLKCVGPDSTLTLSNCELMLEDDYSFTEGYVNFCQGVKIRGPEMPAGTSLVFAYKSPQDATIRSLGHLMLDRYITFSYDTDAASKDKLIMEDATSILHLNGCTLYSTHTGLRLTGGRLIVEDKVTVQNEAVTADEAMVFKDPLEIDVLSGGVLDLTDGLLEYE